MKIIRPPALVDAGGSFSRSSIANYKNSQGVWTSAAIDVPRVHYEYDTNSNQYKCVGILVEPAATNLVINSSSMAVAQVRTITVVQGSTYTLSFEGTGSIAITGGHTYTVPGGTSQVRKTYTFTPTTTQVTLTVSVATVTQVQLELGSTDTSYITTAGTTMSRQADTCTGTGVLYQNIQEPSGGEGVVWQSSSVSYTIGIRVIYQHKIYECILNHTSNATTPPNLPNNWLEVSSTNKYAAFDESPSVVSSNADMITYIIKPGRINSVALLELAATDAIINLYAGGQEVYFARQDLLTNNNVGNWYEYFYEPFYYQTSLALTELVNQSLLDLPQYADTILCVTILKPQSTAIVGSVICGIEYTLGSTQRGVSMGIIDYSIKDTDTFGNTVLTRRKYRKRVRTQVFLYSNKVDAISNLLTQYRATPLVWIGADQAYTSLVMYGFYKDWDIVIDNSISSSLQLEIEGLA